MNVFVLSSVLKEINTGTIFKGILPFFVVDVIRLAIVVMVVPLSLWLPQAIYH